MASPASQFIDESVKHPDWLRIIETGDADQAVHLANEQGFQCSLADLKQAAAELLKTNADAGTIGGRDEDADAGTIGGRDEGKIDDAASGLSDLEGEMGYGDDTGYAALYGVAGVILKM